MAAKITLCVFFLFVLRVAVAQPYAINDTLIVSPATAAGGVHSGDTLTFCYTVRSFNQINSNWFHGVGIQFANGFVSPSLTPISSPASCDGAGNWGFYLTETSSATGQSYGPGFFYESSGGSPTGIVDSLPGNNYGDNCATYNWTFCWKAVVGSCTGLINDSIRMFIQPYPDGVSGSWTSTVSFIPHVWSAPLVCCQGVSFHSTSQTAPGVCNGTATVTANGHPPYTYTWSSGPATASHTGLCPGNYDVTVTDGTGCSVHNRFIINTFDSLSFTFTTILPTCANLTGGSVAVSVVSGIAPYTYSLNGAVYTTSTIYNLAPGTYTLQVTDSRGTSRSIGFTLPSPPPLVDSSNIAITEVSCYGAPTGSIHLAITSGTPPYSILWTNNATSAFIDSLASGSYGVTITDSAGCIYQQTFFVPQDTNIPIINHVRLQKESCGGRNDGSISLFIAGGYPPYIINWNNGATGTAITNLPASTYSISVTDQYGCTRNGSYIISDSIEITITADSIRKINCPGINNAAIFTSVTGGTGPYHLTWTNADTTTAITNLSPGNYQLTVTDLNGCLSIFTETIDAIAPLFINENVSKPLCPGDEGNITILATGGTGPYQYNWSNGSAIKDQYAIAEGDYAMTVTDAHGCRDSAMYHLISQDVISVSDTVNPTTCYNHNGSIAITVTGNNGPFTYHWSTGDNQPVAAHLAAGIYGLTVEDTLNCRFQKVIAVTDTCSIIGIDPVKQAFSVTVVGLPSEHAFLVKIAGGSGQNLAIQIFNTLGQLKNNMEVTTSGGIAEQSIDFSYQPSGIYFIRVSYDAQQWVTKVFNR